MTALNTQTNKQLVLAVIILAALLLRLWHIERPFNGSLAWRQVSTAMMADNYYKSDPNIFYPQVSWNGPGPSYNGREFQTVSYITALLYHILGQHDWVGRLVAILFGVWGVYALYRLVQNVWNEMLALFAAASLAIFPGSIVIDHSFIPDPAMVSLITTSAWMFTGYLKSRNNRHLYLAAGIGCIGVLTKLTGAIIGLPFLYALLISANRLQLSKKQWRTIFITAFLIIIPIAVYYRWAYYLSQHYPPYHFAGSGNWLWNEGLKAWLNESYFLYNTAYIFQHWTMGWPFICLVLTGIIFSFTSLFKKHNFPFSYFFHWWLLGFLFFYLIGAKELAWNFWNFNIAGPAIAAISAIPVYMAFKALKQSFFKWVLLAVVVALIFISNSFIFRNVYFSSSNHHSYELGLELKKQIGKNDLVVVIGEQLGSPVAIYYAGTKGWVFPPHEVENEANNIDELPADDDQSIRALQYLIRRGAKWFGAVSEQSKYIQQNHPAFQQYLDSNFTRVVSNEHFVIYKLSP